MKIRGIVSITAFMLSLVGAVILSSCRRGPVFRIEKDELYYSFFEKTRLIMIDEEIEIYTSLTDRKAKEEFIEEFWKIRDPDPYTLENENKLEFERRVAYANEWFGDWKTFMGRSMGMGKEADRGWRTDKGRIYVVLGHPELVNYSDTPSIWEPMKTYDDKEHGYETWFYPQYQIYVSFYRREGYRWRISGYSQALTKALAEAKMDMVGASYRKGKGHSFRFDVKKKDGNIHFFIPVKRVEFEDIEGRLIAEFHIKMIVYCDKQRSDVIEESREFSTTEDELDDIDDIELAVPFNPTEPGYYLLDIIMTDTKSLVVAKFRRLLKFRVR